MEVVHFGREVEASHQQLGELRDRPVVRGDARIRAGSVEEAAEHVQRPFDSDVVRGAQRASFQREQAAVRRDEREVRLRRAAVDREQGGSAHTCASLAARSSPASSFAVSHCPISGCASSALRTSAGSPESAASTASRS